MEKIFLGDKKFGDRLQKMLLLIGVLSKSFDEGGIKIWFNGTFGVAGYYGYVFDEPGDVDCGVLEKDFSRARKIIEGLGFKNIGNKENEKFKVSTYDAGGFNLEVGTFDHDLGDNIVELEGVKFRVPNAKWLAECYKTTAQKPRRTGKNDFLRAEFLESLG